jgi:hypothetical protein
VAKPLKAEFASSEGEGVGGEAFVLNPA